MLSSNFLQIHNVIEYKRLGGVRDLRLPSFLSKFACQCQWSLLLVCKHSQIQHSGSKINLKDHRSERLYDRKLSESARGIGLGHSSASTKWPNWELGAAGDSAPSGEGPCMRDFTLSLEAGVLLNLKRNRRIPGSDFVGAPWCRCPMELCCLLTWSTSWETLSHALFRRLSL